MNMRVQIENEKPQIIVPQVATLSPVPYAEPSWLSKGYHSPYYNDGHRKFQKVIRQFFDEHVRDEAAMHELNHKRPTVELIKLMGTKDWYLNHMRLGPGKHLHGLTLPTGLRGEDFDYFHELIITQGEFPCLSSASSLSPSSRHCAMTRNGRTCLGVR